MSAANVKASVVREALPAVTPVFPRNALNIALGILAGLLVGVGTAIAVGRIDTSIRSTSDMEALTGAAPLGRVGFDKTAKTNPTATLNGSGSLAR